MANDLHSLADDPRTFFRLAWPNVVLWQRQREIAESLARNYGTIVHSAVGMGKDWIAARLLLWFYCTRHPSKVIAISTTFGQLKDALWGEVGRALRESAIDLGIHAKETLELRRRDVTGRQYEDDWVRLRTAKDVESMGGIHLPSFNGRPAVLAIVDECSGVGDNFLLAIEGQAHRVFAFGNPLRLAGYFLRRVHDGDRRDPLDPTRLRWKVIHIDADDSPNVRAGMAWDKAGREGDCPEPLPGLMTYGEYLSHLEEWDAFNIATRLHGQPSMASGCEPMFPLEWLAASRRRAEQQKSRARQARTIGIDTGQGVANTVWAVCDEFGLLEMVSEQTVDTAEIPGRTAAMMREWRVEAQNVLFDAGGGGREHADRLRRQGHNVRTVAFGESAKPPRQIRTKTTLAEKITRDENRYAFRNRRAEMYWMIRQRLDPSSETPFAIPAKYIELHRQLGLIPLQWDDEGRIMLPPKQRRNPRSTRETLIDIIGHSPDEADALVLAVYGMSKKAAPLVLGVRF